MEHFSRALEAVFAPADIETLARGIAKPVRACSRIVDVDAPPGCRGNLCVSSPSVSVQVAMALCVLFSVCGSPRGSPVSLLVRRSARSARGFDASAVHCLGPRAR